MNLIALVVACLACAGRGRRISANTRMMRHHPYGQSLKLLERVHTSAEGTTINPLRPLAQLLVTLRPSAAFRSSIGLGTCSRGRAGLSSRGLSAGGRQIDHSSSALRPRCSLMRMSVLDSLGAAYAAQLRAQPLVTQSLTSGIMFALSDWTAQSLAPAPEGRDTKRTITTALIGLLYYGPALYYYLKLVFYLFPGTGFKSTVQKMLFGQIGFGPLLTSVFFGAFLVKDNGLLSGLKLLPSKIRQDLFVTWVSELCFWPFVDLICYSMVPARWIPLANNAASYMWTVFLSLRAALKVKTTDE
mmetsp:Transcript_99860/g.187848  ORF Transcript_99860/g.187848 Transcript_99860/m.187848 type:complete len:301 (-) Transcript_99860:35-937(-)